VGGQRAENRILRDRRADRLRLNHGPNEQNKILANPLLFIRSSSAMLLDSAHELDRDDPDYDSQLARRRRLLGVKPRRRGRPKGSKQETAYSPNKRAALLSKRMKARLECGASVEPGSPSIRIWKWQYEEPIVRSLD
jgi:hypothetical protein